jgi:hypothetical protein
MSVSKHWADDTQWYHIKLARETTFRQTLVLLLVQLTLQVDLHYMDGSMLSVLWLVTVSKTSREDVTIWVDIIYNRVITRILSIGRTEGRAETFLAHILAHCCLELILLACAKFKPKWGKWQIFMSTFIKNNLLVIAH